MTATVRDDEIARFRGLSAHWWDSTGPFAALHRFNPARVEWLRDRLTTRFSLPAETVRPLEGLSLLDIGCGGGLLSESLARLRAEVTGIDADAQAIDVARDHAEWSGLPITYHAKPVEALSADLTFDAVIASEVIEHVSDAPVFVGHMAARCRPGGLLLFTTLNRTLASLALAKVGAEYVLGWIPRGTHRWRDFLKPSELGLLLEEQGAVVEDIAGVAWDPLRGFRLDPQALAVNYMLSAIAPG